MTLPAPISSMNQVLENVPTSIVGVDIKIEGAVYAKLLSLSNNLVNWDPTTKTDQENVQEMVVRAIGIIIKAEGRAINLKDKQDSSKVSLIELYK